MLGAKVEVTGVHPAFNSSGLHKEKFELLDTGSGGECTLYNTDNVMLSIWMTLLLYISYWSFQFYAVLCLSLLPYMHPETSRKSPVRATIFLPKL